MKKESKTLRFFAWILAAALLTCLLLPASAAEDTSGTSSLSIDSGHIYEGMEKAYRDGYTPKIADQKAVFVLPLVAEGDISDQKIEVSVKLGETKDSPFVYRNYCRTFTEETCPVDGGETVQAYVVRFDLDLKEQRINGTYPVVFDVTGKDGAGTPFSGQYTIYMTITDGIDRNSGTNTADQNDGNGGTNGTDGNGSQNHADKTDGDDAQNGTDGVGGDDAQTEPGGNGDQISVDDVTDGSSGDTVDGSSGSAASGGGDGTQTPASQPVVLVSGCALNPGTAVAGETVEATVYLKNTSETKAVQNMVVTITYDTTCFQFEGESDTIYISKLKKGEVLELPLTFSSAIGTPEGTYKVDLAMSYDNDEAVSLSSAGAVYLPVKQEARMELTMPRTPERVTAGDTLPLSFQVMNLGRNKVYNVRCEISGYGLFPMSTAFVGDMEPGTAGSADVNVFVGAKDQTEGYTGAESYGDTKGTVTMYYEDAGGCEYTQEYEFYTAIEKMTVNSGSEDEEEESAGQWQISVLIAAGIAAAAGISLAVRRKKSNG